MADQIPATLQRAELGREISAVRSDVATLYNRQSHRPASMDVVFVASWAQPGQVFLHTSPPMMTPIPCTLYEMTVTLGSVGFVEVRAYRNGVALGDALTSSTLSFAKLQIADVFSYPDQTSFTVEVVGVAPDAYPPFARDLNVSLRFR